MKNIILISLFFFMGCGELEKLDNNHSIIAENSKLEEVSFKMEEEIALRMEETLFEKEIELNSTKSVETVPETIESKVYSDNKLKKLIGNMFMVGFYGTDINQNSQIVKDIKNYHLGGVILFDRHPSKRGKSKNIKNPKQLKKLTQKLQKYSNYKLLIATDQEGGKVARLKKKTGFSRNFPSAKDIGSKYKFATIKTTYEEMAEMLSSSGINLNFAPSVDMEINPKNIVIVKLKRSFGKDAKRVVMFSKIFIEAMNSYGVMTSLKHFPGHGSSLGDSHKGFVDITKTWEEKELEPYKLLISEGLVDTIMVAHVFHKEMDTIYPASLSEKIVTGKLRKELGYTGVVVTDDLQMRAISKHYSLEETIKNSMNAGIDILLFGNQLDPKNQVSVEKLVDITLLLVKSGEIDVRIIEEANERIKELRRGK